MIDFDLVSFLYRYVSLLVVLVGCEMFVSFLVASTAPACIESDELLNDDGKITLNPIRYIDPIGTLLVPLVMVLVSSPFLFGYSKSLRVALLKMIDFYGIDRAILLSCAPVFFLFFVAFLASIIISDAGGLGFRGFFEYLVIYSAFFVVIRLFPLLPYDGLKILSCVALKFGSNAVLRFYIGLMRYEIIIFLIIIFTPLINLILIPVRSILNFLL